VFAR